MRSKPTRVIAFLYWCITRGTETSLLPSGLISRVVVRLFIFSLTERHVSLPFLQIVDMAGGPSLKRLNARLICPCRFFPVSADSADAWGRAVFWTPAAACRTLAFASASFGPAGLGGGRSFEPPYFFLSRGR